MSASRWTRAAGERGGQPALLRAVQQLLQHQRLQAQQRRQRVHTRYPIRPRHRAAACPRLQLRQCAQLRGHHVQRAQQRAGAIEGRELAGAVLSAAPSAGLLVPQEQLCGLPKVGCMTATSFARRAARGLQP